MTREEKLEVNKLVAESQWQHIQICELKHKLKTAKEVIEYLLLTLKIEGYDLSDSGCETDEYEMYHKAMDLIKES